METTNKQNSFLRTYKKNQLSTLSRSLIIAGIGFVLICLIGFLSYFLISKFIQTNNAQGLFALLISSTILVFVSLIMSIVVWMRIERIKLSTIILMFSFYVLAQGIGFGFLFYSFIEYQPSGGLIALLGIFGIAGVLFLIAGLIGIQLSVKQIISFGKIVFWFTMAFLGVSVLLMIFMVINYFVPGVFGGIEFWYWGLGIVACFLFFLYMIYDMAMASKISSFQSMQDDKIITKYVWMFGFKLLIDFIGLIWQLASLYLRFKR